MIKRRTCDGESCSHLSYHTFKPRLCFYVSLPRVSAPIATPYSSEDAQPMFTYVYISVPERPTFSPYARPFCEHRSKSRYYFLPIFNDYATLVAKVSRDSLKRTTDSRRVRLRTFRERYDSRRIVKQYFCNYNVP